ncbi:MAG: hypothetical protein IT477_10470 [Rhodanobacteraceae bacterium]|nr:hypothetical protein [Rhodanobacteraceae bacterium]
MSQTESQPSFSGIVLAPGWDELPYADAKDRALDAFHKAYLLGMIRRAGGNISEAARRAGLDRSNFRRVLRRYGVTGTTVVGTPPAVASPAAASVPPVAPAEDDEG